MSNYWGERVAKTQATLTNKSIAQTEKQMKKYYQKSFLKTLGNFEKTYEKIFQDIAEGKEVTPADLYKLDTYWQLQGQLKQELQKLGDKQVALLSKKFVQQYEAIYNGIALPSGATYSTLDKALVEQMVNSIWCTDGKSWSQRIWTNTERLAETLNEHLIHCVAIGAKPTELKKLLQRDFGVSYSSADSLVRTEMAHIQTQASQKRYADYGITEVEVLADADERRCEVCGKLHQKRFPIHAQMPVPAHPRCRCAIIPVVEDSKLIEKEIETPKNVRGEEITFDKATQNKGWESSVKLIKKLSNEYNTRLTTVTPSNLNSAGGVDLGGAMKLSSQKPDIAIHEFAHTIAQTRLTKFGVTDDSEFWKEIKRIKRKYRKDVGEDSSRWISSYAHTNDDEFLAEAFAQAKLKELNLEIPAQYGSDFTYSNEVLEAVNKYFKKKKK